MSYAANYQDAGLTVADVTELADQLLQRHQASAWSHHPGRDVQAPQRGERLTLLPDLTFLGSQG